MAFSVFQRSSHFFKYPPVLALNNLRKTSFLPGLTTFSTKYTLSPTLTDYFLIDVKYYNLYTSNAQLCFLDFLLPIYNSTYFFDPFNPILFILQI